MSVVKKVAGSIRKSNSFNSFFNSSDSSSVSATDADNAGDKLLEQTNELKRGLLEKRNQAIAVFNPNSDIHPAYSTLVNLKIQDESLTEEDQFLDNFTKSMIKKVIPAGADQENLLRLCNIEYDSSGLVVEWKKTVEAYIELEDGLIKHGIGNQDFKAKLQTLKDNLDAHIQQEAQAVNELRSQVQQLENHVSAAEKRFYQNTLRVLLKDVVSGRKTLNQITEGIDLIEQDFSECSSLGLTDNQSKLSAMFERAGLQEEYKNIIAQIDESEQSNNVIEKSRQLLASLPPSTVVHKQKAKIVQDQEEGRDLN